VSKAGRRQIAGRSRTRDAAGTSGRTTPGGALALRGDRGVLGWPDRDTLGGVATIGVGRARGNLPRAGLRALRYPHKAAVISNLVITVLGWVLLIGCLLWIRATDDD
jgi:hypothetical protein